MKFVRPPFIMGLWTGMVISPLLLLQPFSSAASSVASTAAAGASSSASSSSQQRQQLHRSLEIGDFEELNTLFENAKIDLSNDGPFVVSEKVGFIDLDLEITDLICFGLNIGDIVLERTLIDPTDGSTTITQLQVEMLVRQLDVSCTMKYKYDYGLLKGDGTLEVETDNNGVAASMVFDAIQVEADVTQCVPDIEITELDFDGDFVSNIIEVFQRLIRGVIEREVGKVACDELGSIGTSLISGVMEKFHTRFIEPYLDIDIPSPLSLEESLDLPSTTLDWTNEESTVTQFLNQVIPFVDVYLSSKVDGTLRINSMIRNALELDESTGALILEPSQLGNFLDDTNILFEGHDRMLQTTILLNQISILGLDSITEFDTLETIGKHTLSNSWTWSQLEMKIDVTIQMAPSTLEDAILSGITSEGIQEDISITMKAEDITVLSSLLIALDEPSLAKLQLGSFLDTKNIIECVWSVVNRLDLTGLNVQYKNVDPPVMSGFISPGIDRLFSDAVMAALDLYEASKLINQTLPALFGTTVVDIINQFIIDPMVSESQSSVCPLSTADQQSGLLDYSAFFQTENNAFGDLPAMLKTMMDEELFAPTMTTANGGGDGNGGRMKINEALLEPFTKRQSGVEGRMNIVDSLWNVDSEAAVAFGLDSVQLSGRELFMKNIDTIISPSHFLRVSSGEPYLLENQVTFEGEKTTSTGTNGRSMDDTLSVHLDGLWALVGDEALATRNELDFSFDLGGSSWIVDVLAPMVTKSLLQFPIVDTFNTDCWLATLDELSLEKFVMDVPNLNLNLTCTNCTSIGLSKALPDVMTLLQPSKKILEDRIIELGMEWIRSESTREYLNGLVQDSKLRCPHSPTFDASTVNNNDNEEEGTTTETNTEISLATADKVIMGMSYEGLETIAFGVTMIVQMATAVLSEAYPNATSMTDPLSAQRIQDALDNNTASSTPLVNFMELEQTMSDSMGMNLDDLAEYLTFQESNGGELRINKLLRSSILNDDGILEINFADTSIGGAEAEMTLKNVRIVGLDSIDRLNILEILGAQTMQNQVRFQKLGLEVTISLLGLERSTKTATDITLGLGFSDVAVSAALFAAMDLDLLGSIKLGSLLDFQNLLPCVLAGARGAELTQLTVSVGSLDRWSVDGFLDGTLTEASTSNSNLIMDAYGSKLVSAIPAIFDETIRVLINNWLEHMIEEKAGAFCTESTYLESTAKYIDLRDLLLKSTKSVQLGGSGLSPYGNLFPTILSFIKDAILKIDSTTGLSAINELLIAPWTLAQSNETGDLVYPGELFTGGARINIGELDTTVTIRLTDAKIENLDTIGSPLNLLEATRSPYLLNNTAAMGILADRPLRFSVRLFFSLIGDDEMEVRNEVDLSLDLSTAIVMLKSMAMVAESNFYNFPIRDLTDLSCWMAMIPPPQLDDRGVRRAGVEPTASLVKLAAEVAKIGMNLTCVECTSPKMAQLSEMIASPEGQREITILVNDVLNYIGKLAGGDFAQTNIDRMLNDAARQCPHSPLYVANYTAPSYKAFKAIENEFDISSLILLGALAIAFVVLLIVVIYAIRFIVARRHERWLGNLPPTTIRSIARTQARERKAQNQLNSGTQSMFTSPEIPVLVRWGMPFVILGNIAFFLSGHLSLGATVNIEAEIAGERLTIEKFFEFSMAASTIDIWNSGGKELAIMILVFSGIWPYTKQIITMVLWFASPARVSVHRRGAILLWLDFWGKWSFVDVFVLVISIAAFRVSIASPNTSFLPEGFYFVEMMVVPLWGLYANMIAQLISQVSSHFIIYYHRKIVANAQPPVQDSVSIQDAVNLQDTVSYRDAVSIAVPPTRLENLYGQEKRHSITTANLEQSIVFPNREAPREDPAVRQALFKHQFSRPHRGETEKLVVRKGVNALYVFGIVSMVLLVIVGCTIPSFSLEFLGIVGVAVEVGQDFEAAKTEQSVFSVLRLLMDQARFLGTGSNKVGLLSMSIVFVITILFVPIFQTIALTRQWFFAATPQERAKMEVIIEGLGAWQYAEVYLLAVFVSSWQLGPISQFMINAYCDNLEDLFAQAVHYGFLREEDAQCFAVEASIEKGFYYLAAGAIILGLLSSFTTKAVTQYFRDRDPNIKSFQDSISDAGMTIAHSDDEEADDSNGAVDAGFITRIHPVPVLFTDTFRWTLRGDPSSVGKGRGIPPGSSREILVYGDSIFDDEHWDLPEAQAVACDDDDEYSMSKHLDKKVQEYSPTQIAAYSHPPARRQMDFDDDPSVAYQPSVMDSASSASDDWRSIASSSAPSRFDKNFGTPRANLKDDAAYATPPPTPAPAPADDHKPPSSTNTKRSHSDKTVPRTNNSGSASVAYSILSASSNKASSSRRPGLKEEPVAAKSAPDGPSTAKDPRRSIIGDLMNSMKFKVAADRQQTVSEPTNSTAGEQQRSAPISAAPNGNSDRMVTSFHTAQGLGGRLDEATETYVDDGNRTLEEILNEADDEYPESEYYEETIDETGTYDEYTLDNYEEMSQYTDEVGRRGGIV